MTDKMPVVDIEAWISQASLPEIEETVYRDGKLLADIGALERRMEGASRNGGDDRFGGRSTSREALEAELAELLATAAGGALTIRFRALTDAQRDALGARHPEPGEKATQTERAEWDRAFGVDMLAEQTVEPKISAAQYAALRDAIGDAQTQKLIDACGYVNRAVMGDAPFWRRVSGSSPA